MRGCSKSAWADGWMPSMWSIPMLPSSPASVSIIRNTWATRSRPSRGRRPASSAPGETAVIGGREPSLVLESIARGLKSPLKRLAIEYNYILDGSGWRYRGTRWDLPHLPAPALLGDIQFTNAATALAALEEISPRLSIPAAAIAQGLIARALGRPLPSDQTPARVSPAWVLDVAHNPDAARVLARNLNASSHLRQDSWRYVGFWRTRMRRESSPCSTLHRRMVVRVGRRRARPQRTRRWLEMVQEEVRAPSSPRTASRAPAPRP